jgi:Tfp pilus assembly pilus retraction ATPase PilT
MEKMQHEQQLRALLILAGQQGASDLHLAVGRYPTLRIDGKLHPLEDQQTPRRFLTFS